MSKIKINLDSLKSRREWKRHQVKDGSNIFRILPPFGDVEVHNNYPYKKWSVAWLIDPRTNKRRPFASPLTEGDNRCPVYECQQAINLLFNSKKAQLEASGASKEAIKEQLAPLAELQWNIRIQHGYLYNACDKSGTVGLLELKSTAHSALKKKMAQYISKYGQDPTSLNSDTQNDSGVWFDIKREGSGKQTTYTVDFNSTSFKDENGDIVFKHDREPLPQHVVENYEDLAYDLSSIYRLYSYDDLKSVLLYTLAEYAKTNNAAAEIPGFELDDQALEAAQSQTETDKPYGEAIMQEVAAQQPPKQESPAKPVNLNLGNEGDDLDDIMELANSLYGDK